MLRWRLTVLPSDGNSAGYVRVTIEANSTSVLLATNAKRLRLDFENVVTAERAGAASGGVPVGANDTTTSFRYSSRVSGTRTG